MICDDKNKIEHINCCSKSLWVHVQKSRAGYQSFLTIKLQKLCKWMFLDDSTFYSRIPATQVLNDLCNLVCFLPFLEVIRLEPTKP